MDKRLCALAIGLALFLAIPSAAQDVPAEDDPRRPQPPPGAVKGTNPIGFILGAPFRALDAGFYSYARSYEERCGSVAAGLAAAERCRRKHLSFSFGSLGSKSGFWGGGFGVHNNLIDPDGFKIGFTTAATWRAYQLHQAYVGWNDPARQPYIRATAYYDLDKRNAFFGLGDETDQVDEADYSWERIGGNAEIGVPRRFGLWGRGGVQYEKSFVFEGTDDSQPDVVDAFPDVAGADDPQLEFWGPYGEVVIDLTDAPGHPVKGVKLIGRGEYWMSVDSDDAFNWMKYGAEAQGHLPLGSPWHILSVKAGFDRAEADEADDEIPFTYLPYLGGSVRLRGYETWRFMDQTAAYGTAEYRYRIWQENAPDPSLASAIETAIFYDVGDVGEDLDDIDLGEFNSYGFEFRLYVARNSSFRFGLARSEEGTRFNFSFRDIY